MHSVRTVICARSGITDTEQKSMATACTFIAAPMYELCKKMNACPAYNLLLPTVIMIMIYYI